MTTSETYCTTYNLSSENSGGQYLVATRGMSGSGKSTWARAWVAEDPVNRRRVNRDDIRSALFTVPQYSPSEEKLVTKVAHEALESFLGDGYSVVLDNTHLQTRYLRELFGYAVERDIPFIVMSFEILFDEAVSRVVSRAAMGGLEVSEEVLQKQWKQFTRNGKLSKLPEVLEVLSSQKASNALDKVEPYVRNVELPSAFLVDVDGTLMDMGGRRGPYEYDKVLLDTPIQPVVEVVLALQKAGHAIIIMSGREDSCAADTLSQVEATGIQVAALHMRATGDQRQDAVIKAELFDSHIRNKWNIVAVLDDRQQVVDMYRDRLGIHVLQCAEGNF